LTNGLKIVSTAVWGRVGKWELQHPGAQLNMYLREGGTGIVG